jgi:transcriptional regulator with XRE-family HTH domain
MSSFGELLRDERRKAGITQRDLAAKANLDFSYISKLENDRIPPPAADTIVVICRILNVDPVDLLAASGKFPAHVQSAVGSSAAAQSFLENASKMGLTEGEWKELSSSLHRLRES